MKQINPHISETIEDIKIPSVVIKNQELFKKTEEEKRRLKELKKQLKQQKK